MRQIDRQPQVMKQPRVFRWAIRWSEEVDTAFRSDLPMELQRPPITSWSDDNGNKCRHLQTTTNSRKPTVGGSENEWGGNLNDNFDDIDELLSGESPLDGVEIINGTIDGGAITGELGKELEDGEDPLKIHESTWINGKIAHPCWLGP